MSDTTARNPIQYRIRYHDIMMTDFGSKSDTVREVTVDCDEPEAFRNALLEYILYVRSGYPPQFRFSDEIVDYFAENGLTYESPEPVDSDDEIDGFHIYPTDADDNNISTLLNHISKQSTEHIYEFIKNFIKPRPSWVWQPTRMESKRVPVHNNRQLVEIIKGTWTKM
jgi:hypothetical protein